MTQNDINRLMSMINLIKEKQQSYYVISQKRDDRYWYLFDIDDSKATRLVTLTKSKNSAVRFMIEIVVL